MTFLINAVCIDPAVKQWPPGNLTASSQDLPPHGGVFLPPFASTRAMVAFSTCARFED